MRITHDRQLILVTHKGSSFTSAYLERIALCIKGGVTSVQLREKSLSRAELLHFGRSLKNLLDSNNIPLIVNDHVDLCLQLDAAGVHLGQSDEEPLEARAKLGPQKIIGLSVNTMAQIEEANTLPLDYIGVGAIFHTQNKSDVETIWGLEGLKKASIMSSHPIVAIGGVTPSNALSVLQAGAKGIAAIGAFHDAVDPYLSTQHFINTINEV